MSDESSQPVDRTKAAAVPRAATATELKAQIEAERAGGPFLVYRDADQTQLIRSLADAEGPLWIGRRSSAEICLSWDPEVSGLHAQLEVVGNDCTLVDDGLSRNGSYVNGDRVRGRCHVRDGDMLRFGATVIRYRAPGEGGGDSTAVSTDPLTSTSLTDAQRRVLVALCRPFKDATPFTSPASNQQIADELVLSVEAVKTHLSSLFAKFGVEAFPQNRKRLALVERALQSGLITERDL